MKRKLIQVTYEIELKTGEKFRLPESITDNIDGGTWRITIEKIASEKPAPTTSNRNNLFPRRREDGEYYED